MTIYLIAATFLLSLTYLVPMKMRHSNTETKRIRNYTILVTLLSLGSVMVVSIIKQSTFLLCFKYFLLFHPLISLFLSIVNFNEDWRLIFFLFISYFDIAFIESVLELYGNLDISTVLMSTSVFMILSAIVRYCLIILFKPHSYDEVKIVSITNDSNYEYDELKIVRVIDDSNYEYDEFKVIKTITNPEDDGRSDDVNEFRIIETKAIIHNVSNPDDE